MSPYSLFTFKSECFSTKLLMMTVFFFRSSVTNLKKSNNSLCDQLKKLAGEKQQCDLNIQDLQAQMKSSQQAIFDKVNF